MKGAIGILVYRAADGYFGDHSITSTLVVLPAFILFGYIAGRPNR